jgi:hypothetical protein
MAATTTADIMVVGSGSAFVSKTEEVAGPRRKGVGRSTLLLPKFQSD